MANVVGGLRARLIKDNVVNMIEDSLNSLGWFDANRSNMSLIVVDESVEESEEVKPNIISVTEEDVYDFDLELGSNLAEFNWQYYVDIYAEDTAVGLHLATDVRDILQGRFSTSTGRDRTSVPVYDLRMATPELLFYVDIDGVFLSRSRVSYKPHHKFWWVVGFSVVDEYGSEDM
jgi:hypothetical protein